MNNGRKQTRLPILLRPDLQFAERATTDPLQVVKDPVALQYYMLRREEAAILQMLDGEVTLDDIKRMYDEKFAPSVTNYEQILTFLSKAYKDGLVVIHNSQQTRKLLDRGSQAKRVHAISRILNPFVIRWRGFNPNAFLDRHSRKLDWMFTLPFLAICMGCILAAAIIAVLNLHSLRSRPFDFYSIFATQHIAMLLVTFVAMKVLHELGHAFTCKHFGGEVHELGILFIVGMPLLYCNVSDTWMFRDRWQRVVVSSAGIIVELTLAAIATFVWRFTEPGLVNAVARSVMIVGSVNTLVANGNPLLRFDGYFVLSDALNLPNLWARSRALVYNNVARLMLGTPLYSDRTLPTRGRYLLSLYALLSIGYRVLVVVALFWFARQMFAASGIDALFPFVAALAGMGISLGPAMAMIRMGKNPMFRQRVNSLRVSFSAAVLTLMLAAFFFLPLPTRIRAHAIITGADSVAAYVTVPGIVVESVRPAEYVSAGDQIAKLRNLDIELQIKEAKSEFAVQETKVRSLVASEMQDARARRALPTAREELTFLSKRWQDLQSQADKLIITAPVDGVIIPNYRKEERFASADDAWRLQSWQGNPLDDENAGCLLETGTICCSVGQPSNIEATLVLDEREVRFVQTGQTVKLRVPGIRTTIQGAIVAISERGVRHDLRSAAEDFGVTLNTPERTLYEAQVKLEPYVGAIPTMGVKGDAVVRTAPRTLADRLVDAFRGMLSQS